MPESEPKMIVERDGQGRIKRVRKPTPEELQQQQGELVGDASVAAAAQPVADEGPQPQVASGAAAEPPAVLQYQCTCEVTQKQFCLLHNIVPAAPAMAAPLPQKESPKGEGAVSADRGELVLALERLGATADEIRRINPEVHGEIQFRVKERWEREIREAMARLEGMLNPGEMKKAS